MLRVFTLNLHGYGPGHGPWETRRELIAAGVREASPDVIALQAVRRDALLYGGVDQATQLARMLGGYTVFYAPATDLGQGVMEGSAILSRVPLAERDVRVLDGLGPDDEDPTVRLVLRARVQSGGRALEVMNSHFSWLPENNARNVAQATAYLVSVRGPVLVVGDFNAPPDAESLAPLRAAGFTDVWERLRPGEPGYTFEQGRLFTRIDFAWASADLEVAARGRGRGVRTIDVAARQAAPGDVHASDHLGLIVDVDLG